MVVFVWIGCLFRQLFGLNKHIYFPDEDSDLEVEIAYSALLALKI